MRKKLLLVLLAGVIILGSSCKETIEKLTGSMEATIAGSAWNATTQVGVQYSDYVTFYGFALDGRKILISIKATTTGTYTFSALEGAAQTYAIYFVSKDEEGDDSKKYLTTQGSVTVSSITDNRISGTFNFQAANSLQDVIEITNGEFTNIYIPGN